MVPSKNEMSRVSSKLTSLLRSNKYEDAITLLETKLKKHPMEFWLLTNLAVLYIEFDYCSKALKLSNKAFKLEPNDPLVVDNHAYILYRNKKPEEAIQIWEELLKNGLSGITSNPYSESKKWAESLYIDIHYSLSLCYLAIGDESKAIKYILKHLKKRKKGLSSVYKKRDVIKKLDSIKI